MDNCILNHWEQFENWLLSSEAQKIIKTDNKELIDSFSMGVIVREWFNMHGLDINYYNFFIDEYNFLPSFILNNAKKNSTLIITIKLSSTTNEFENVKKLILQNIKSITYNFVIIIPYYSKHNDFKSIIPYTKKQKLIKLESIIYVMPLYIPIKDYHKSIEDVPISYSPLVNMDYLPDFFQRNYLSNLMESLKKLDPILQKQKSIYNLTLAFQESNDIFKVDDLKSHNSIKHKNIILLGIGGSGKTTLVRQLVLKYISTKEEYIPVYIQLNRYKAQGLLELIIEVGIIQHYGIKSLGLDQLMGLFKNIPIFLVFDGYDELDLNYRDKFWTEFNLIKALNTRIMITGRFLEDLKSHVNDSIILSIRPMIPSQIEEMTEKYEGKNSVKVLEFIEKHSLEKEAKVPLWLLFIMLVIRIPTEKIKNDNLEHFTRGKIYQWLIEYYFLEQWESKQKSNIPLDLKRDFLSELSFEMHHNYMVSLRRKDIYDIYTKNSAYFGNYAFEDYLIELQRHQLLIYEAGCYQFPHKTFLEYFAALKLLRIISKTGVKLYLNEHWYEVLRFCIGLHSIQTASDLLNVVLDEYPDWYLKDKISEIGTHKFLDIFFEIRGFCELKARKIDTAINLLDKIKNYINLFVGLNKDSTSEYGIKLCQLFQPMESLKYLQFFLTKSQNIQVEVIDLLGKVFSEDAVKIIVDQVMLSEDERILRVYTKCKYLIIIIMKKYFGLVSI